MSCTLSFRVSLNYAVSVHLTILSVMKSKKKFGKGEECCSTCTIGSNNGEISANTSSIDCMPLICKAKI